MFKKMICSNTIKESEEMTSPTFPRQGRVDEVREEPTVFQSLQRCTF